MSLGTQNRPPLGTLKPAIFRVIKTDKLIILPPITWRKKNGKYSENGKTDINSTIIKT